MFLKVLAALTVTALTLHAQQAATTASPATTTFRDDSLGLQMEYASSLHDDTASARSMQDHCLHALLSLHTASGKPEGTVSLFEFSRTCVSDSEWQNRDRMLASMTKAIYNQPGAHPISKPLIYDYGAELTAQRIHMAAVRRDESPTLQMDFSTFVHDRALLWVVQSNDLAQLNALSKLKLRFDGSRAVPLFPASIQPTVNASQKP